MNIMYYRTISNTKRTSNLEDTLNVVKTIKKELNLKVTILWEYLN